MEEKLQKFVKLVNVGSFTKAAEELHVSQPALTVAIAKLERELGVQLLLREKRPLALTEAGKLAYDAGVAQGVVLENLRTELNDLTRRRLSVRIGLVDSVAATLFARSSPLIELEKKADVSVIVNNSRYLQQAIDEHALDAAVVVAGGEAESIPGLFAKELMILVCAPQLAASKQKILDKSQLTDFISYDKPSRTANIIEKELSGRGVKVITRLQSSSPEVMCRMVLSGSGVAVLPFVVVRNLLVTGALTVLTINGAPVTVGRGLNLLKTSGKKHAAAVERFVDEMKTAFEASYDEAVRTIAKLKLQ